MFKKLISFIDELFINDKEELFSKPKTTILGTPGYIPKTKRSLLIKETETNSENESKTKTNVSRTDFV